MPKGGSQKKIVGDINWMVLGACYGTDPNIFFPDLSVGRGNRQDSDPAVQRALAFCAACSVEDECLNYALTNHIKDGIWGGMCETDRDRLKRKSYRTRAVS